MADPIVTSPALRVFARWATVYLRAAWSDDWEEQEHLYCSWVQFSAAPTISTAGLEWDYGRGMRQGETAYDTVEPLDPLGGKKWVKIEIDQPARDPLVWYGRIEEDARAAAGALQHDGARVASGRQSLLAYGMEILLQRQQVTSCFWEHEDGREIELGRALPINEPNQADDEGNCSENLGPQGTYIFTGDLDRASHWTSQDIVDYLLKYHQPVNNLGAVAVPWKLDDGGRQFVPDWDEPQLPLHGKTLKEIFDTLLDRRRLLGYTVEVEEVDDGLDQCVLRPFTYSEGPIVIPAGGIMPANDQQRSLDFDFAFDIEEAVIKRTASQTYDQVIVRGDRVLCCGTISAQDGTLVPHWSVGQRNAYNQAASAEAGYAALELSEKQRRNAEFRQADSLSRVFSYFGLPDDWDGLVADGEGGTGRDLFPYGPLEVDDGAISGFWRPGLRLERQLPLRTDHDYSDDNIPDAIDDNTPIGQQWEYRRPLVVILLSDTKDAPYPYCQVERLAATNEIEYTGDGEGRRFSCSVRMQETAPGLVLRVSGRPQHAIATGNFSAADDTDDYLGELDWEDNLAATVAVRSDYHVRSVWPAAIAGAEDAVRLLEIDVGRRGQCHYVAPGTIVDLADGRLRHTNEGGLIRDDRDRLEQIARLAFEWYGQQRQALTLAWRTAWIAGKFRIGDLITSIGAGATFERVRTVVTDIRVELAASDDQEHGTRIATQWAELDPMTFWAWPEEADR